MLSAVRKLFVGTPAQTSPVIQQRLRQQHENLDRFDVTPFAAEFDLNWLAPVQNAPARMSRAERLMMFSLAFCLRPQRYLEIGTFRGGSALVVCSALDALQSDGRIFLVDPAPEISLEDWHTLVHRTELFEGYSPDILRDVAARALGPFDLVLVDGDHSFTGVKRDAEGVLAYVRPGSYIVFHDGFFPEVRCAIDEFVEQHANRIIDFGMPTREITVQIADDGRQVEWGGLRMLYVEA